MKKTSLKKWFSLVLCLALLAAAALSSVSLAETDTAAEAAEETVAAAETAEAAGEAEAAEETAEETVILMTGTQEEPVLLGEGELAFLFEVIDPEENESWFEIHTDAETVGAALLENGLIAGSESEYGLYVTSVCGIELIWSEENPHYWAFYINGEYAQTGVDMTEIEAEAVYLFKAE